MNTITVDHVSKNYRRVRTEEGLWNSLKSLVFRNFETVKALENVSFSLEQGEMVGLIGPNGAGKSTLIKTLCGLIHPSQGTVKVFDFKPTDKKNAFKQQIGVVLGQKNQLWWDLSPVETFKLHQEIYNIPEEEFNISFQELTQLLRVEHVLTTPVRNLSLGERMKCELIASLLHRPKILFLDEPTIGLDIISQKKIRSFLKQYCVEKKITVILTSHYMDDIHYLCDRVLIMKSGTLFYDGKLQSIQSFISDYKYLRFTFKTVIPHTINLYDQVEEIDRQTLVIRVASANAKEVLQHITSCYSVVDYSEERIPVQDVLEHIFSEPNKVSNGRDQHEAIQ
ncbi:ABC transporter ATP-binding protein [Marininema halotolerans]|uniref:ABC-2 type transport system ATP-binding protein n=1 Tax=Marininema halotolerans TaxID=1155944 RepID=A0A1I6P6B7_9BACL|nr:ATP-binding cassette domain-containing protein [Marininema halotolerans]SFS35722.1 ABC-2 type transport system ATP-binding protein [Marininema halotolerans]